MPMAIVTRIVPTAFASALPRKGRSQLPVPLAPASPISTAAAGNGLAAAAGCGSVPPGCRVKGLAQLAARSAGRMRRYSSLVGSSGSRYMTGR